MCPVADTPEGAGRRAATGAVGLPGSGTGRCGALAATHRGTGSLAGQRRRRSIAGLRVDRRPGNREADSPAVARPSPTGPATERAEPGQCGPSPVSLWHLGTHCTADPQNRHPALVTHPGGQHRPAVTSTELTPGQPPAAEEARLPGL